MAMMVTMTMMMTYDLLPEDFWCTVLYSIYITVYLTVHIIAIKKYFATLLKFKILDIMQTAS